MKTETKKCQNCEANFDIQPEDFDFYSKKEVPAPTFCPECRMIRRMMFRNEHSLYRRKLDTPVGEGREVISSYAPEKKMNICDQKFWWSDSWDPFEYGKEYDFSRPFFEQFKEFWKQIPVMNLSNSKAVNSEFCNIADTSKDCYLLSGSYDNERVLYSNRTYKCKDSLDLYTGFRNELSYDNVSCSDVYQVRYSQNSSNCTNSYFLYDCKNCQNCFGCTNLRNKNYCIFNQQYTKEEYEKKIKELNIESYKSLEELKNKFNDLRLESLHKYAQVIRSINSTGDNLEDCKNCKYSFDLTEGAEDCKFIHWGAIKIRDSYDSGPGVGDGAELLYETLDSGIQGGRMLGTNVVYGCFDIEYSFNCHGSSNLFGCIALRGKKYCIFNKQYSKEEYHDLRSKIIKHMNEMPYVDKKGREHVYGDFFPAEISPFGYNETVAQDYFPLTKEEALSKGYAWRDPEIKKHTSTIKATDLSDKIEGVSDDILDQVIECEHQGKCNDGCTFAFKLVSDELNFYKKMNLPLPRLCFKCRHYQRLRKKNPMKLWKRQCMCDYQIYNNSTKHSHHEEERCLNEFETTYAPERKEIVYCEVCYNAEVI